VDGCTIAGPYRLRRVNWYNTAPMRRSQKYGISRRSSETWQSERIAMVITPGGCSLSFFPCRDLACVDGSADALLPRGLNRADFQLGA
jgi:hypothetical protein